MNNQPMTCDPDRIEQFLGHQLSDDEQTTFEQHLDDCSHCRHQLETTAADDAVWSAVRDSLQPEDEETNPASTDDSAVIRESVLGYLAPTDDERMIGRLGTYEVMGVIGSGGMGVVLKALDTALNRYVAIKVLAPHLATSGSARKRFSREAQAAAAVVHDNVIEIHGVSEFSGLPYLVMPYVSSPSLQRRLDQQGPLSVAEILRIGTQAAAGLAAAHAQGLVHRDVKPANILLADGVERAKLTDFGLARAADDCSLTRTGIIAGTPQFMSPEQARGDSVDQRSDLFSLGSVLYAMATGRAPFRAETSYGVLRRITDDAPKPIREINPDIPEWLCQIIRKLLSKQADGRYESASEVAGLLKESLAHVQQPTAVSLPASLTTPQPKKPHLIQIARRNSGTLAILAAFGFALCGWFCVQATSPPDLSGTWSGEGWGTVVLHAESRGTYTGSYTDDIGNRTGDLELQWSRIERRFNGTWHEGTDRFGKISLRVVDGEVHGAWTTSRKSKTNPGTPALADLTWKRSSSSDASKERSLRGSWQLVLPPDAISNEPDEESFVLTVVDDWRLNLVDTGDLEGRTHFLYTIKPNNTLHLVDDDGSAAKEKRVVRYKWIDNNNLIIVGLMNNSRETPAVIPETITTSASIDGVSFLHFRRKNDHTRILGRWNALKISFYEDDISEEMLKTQVIFQAQRMNVDRPGNRNGEREIDVYDYVLMDDGKIKLQAIREGQRKDILLGRYSLDGDRLWMAISVLDNPTAYPNDAKGNPRQADVQYLSLVRVQTVPGIGAAKATPAKMQKKNPSVNVPGLDSSLNLTEPPITSLADAVREHNRRQAAHAVGNDQPKLTEQEVIASVRWALVDGPPEGLPRDCLAEFREIATDRRLANHWKLEFTSQRTGAGQDRFRAWTVYLVYDPPSDEASSDRSKFVHTVRTQFLGRLDPNGQIGKNRTTDDSTNDPDAIPLAAAINGFNQSHRQVDGQAQPPLTPDEVIAAIQHWRTRRDEAPVTDRDFARFQSIASKQAIPPGARIEQLQQFEPGDGHVYYIWSVRIVMPDTREGKTFAYTIRERFVSCKSLSEQTIHWGPAGENGIQAGVSFGRPEKIYPVGTQVTPRFHFRNTGGPTIQASFPRLMTRGYYEEITVLDDENKTISIVQDSAPAGPVGWMEVPFRFGAQHVVPGLPIVFSDSLVGDAETAIPVTPGQVIRVRFHLSNPTSELANANNLDDLRKPLQTGEVTFSIGK